jgi:aromatic ring hydroxylase
MNACPISRLHTRDARNAIRQRRTTREHHGEAPPPAQTVEEFVRTYNEHDMVANHALIDPAFVRYGRTTGWQPMV